MFIYLLVCQKSITFSHFQPFHVSQHTNLMLNLSTGISRIEEIKKKGIKDDRG